MVAHQCHSILCCILTFFLFVRVRKLQAYIRYFLETKSKTSSLFSACFTYPSKSRLSSSSHFHVSFLIHAAMLFKAKSLVTTPSQCIMGYGTPRPWLFFFFRYGTAGPWLFFFFFFFFFAMALLGHGCFFFFFFFFFAMALLGHGWFFFFFFFC